MKASPNWLRLLSLGMCVKCHSLNLSPALARGFVVVGFWVGFFVNPETERTERSKEGEKVRILTT